MAHTKVQAPSEKARSDVSASARRELRAAKNEEDAASMLPYWTYEILSCNFQERDNRRHGCGMCRFVLEGRENPTKNP